MSYALRIASVVVGLAVSIASSACSTAALPDKVTIQEWSKKGKLKNLPQPDIKKEANEARRYYDSQLSLRNQQVAKGELDLAGALSKVTADMDAYYDRIRATYEEKYSKTRLVVRQELTCTSGRKGYKSATQWIFCPDVANFQIPDHDEVVASEATITDFGTTDVPESVHYRVSRTNSGKQRGTVTVPYCLRKERNAEYAQDVITLIKSHVGH